MSREIYTIYKAINQINGKCYVGFDSNWPDRMKTHNWASFYKRRTGYDNLLHRAIRKYGKDTFIWEILYQSLDGNHCLNEMEPHFIAESNSFGNNGYNMTMGGEGTLGKICSEETKEKIRQKALGRVYSQETKDKLSRMRKGVSKSAAHKDKISQSNKGKNKGRISPFKGRKHTQEAKEKNRLAHYK